MCACEPGYTCSRCRDTPHDPRYLEEADPRDDDAATRAGWTWGDGDDADRR